MDYSNLRPVKPEPDVVQATDWRTHFDSRQSFINNIILQNYDNLKKLLELEEQLYSTATSQIDYQQKVSSKLWNVEMAIRNVCVTDSLPAYPVVNDQNQVLAASSSQTEGENTSDLQEQLYRKLKAMKDMYLEDLNEMHQKIVYKLHQNEAIEQAPKEQVDRIRMMKSFLERVITFLQMPKGSIPIAHRKKMGSYEKQIVAFLNSNRVKKPVPPHQGQQKMFPGSMA